METIKGLIKSLINGGIGAIVGAAFATAFGWNEWILTVAISLDGYCFPKVFGKVSGKVKKNWQKRIGEKKNEKERRESDDKERCSRVGVYHTLPVAFAVRNYVSSHCGRRNT